MEPSTSSRKLKRSAAMAAPGTANRRRLGGGGRFFLIDKRLVGRRLNRFGRLGEPGRARAGLGGRRLAFLRAPVRRQSPLPLDQPARDVIW